MKIFLCMIAALTAIIILILISKINLHVYFDGNLKVKAEICRFFRIEYNIPILYRKKKELSGQKVQEKTESAEKKKKAKPQDEETESPKFKDTVVFVQECVGSLFDILKKRLYLKKFRFEAVAAAEDPHVAAELYGVISSVAAFMWSICEGIKRKKKNSVYIKAVPDFIASKPDFLIDIQISVRIWGILSILKSVLNFKKKYNLLPKKEPKTKNKNRKGKMASV